MSRIDPAGVMIVLGGVVLLLALWWLLTTPRSEGQAGADAARLAQLEQRLTTLDGLREPVTALAAKMQALEGRAPPDLTPVQTQLAALAERTTTAERAATQAGERANAAERRAQALEARPTIDPAAFAPRDAVEALATRLERQAGRAEQQDAEQARRTQELSRLQDERRLAAEQAFGQRLAALDASLNQRLAAIEQAQQRLLAIESRTTRLAAVDNLRGALAAGQPLAAALARIDQPPPALTRFAQAAPPTDSALRLSFEEAARTARAASDAAAQPDGSRSGVVDSALARLGGLVTIRRGEQVVWGDAAEAELERARRALEAGDLEGTLARLEKLPAAAREAMKGWTDQAQALLAARAALRQLAAG